MKQYSPLEMNAFQLVDKFIEHASKSDGTSFYDVSVDIYTPAAQMAINLLKDHGLITYRSELKNRESILDLSRKGFEILRMGGIQCYLDHMHAESLKQSEEIELNRQKVKNEAWLTTKQVSDYRRTRTMAIISFILSIVLTLYEIFSRAYN